MSFTVPLLFSLLALTPARATILSGSTNLGAIWFVGDSITQSNADGDGNGSPRKSLYDRLTAGGYTFTYTGSSTNNPDGLSGINYTSHSGYSGSMVTNPTNMDGRVDMTATLNGTFGTSGVSNQWGTGLLATVKPNVVLIMLGTNDIDQMARTGSNPAAVALNLQAYVNKIYSLPGSINPTVFISTIAPNRTDGVNGTKTVNTASFNAALPNVAAALHAALKDVYLVDSFTPLNNNYSTAMNGDNLHPNATGNGLIADAWYAGIVSRVTATPEPSTGGLLGISALAAALVRRRRRA